MDKRSNQTVHAAFVREATGIRICYGRPLFRILSLSLRSFLFAALFAAESLAEPSMPVLRAKEASWLPGVNLAVGDFGSGSRLWTDYGYPSNAEIDYYTGKGFRLFRIPFLARRVIQPTLASGGRLTIDMDILLKLIDHAAVRNAYVVLDMHDYGSIFTAGLIGRDPLATEEFAAAWRLIAERVKDRPNVIFGLMNEPHKQTAPEWLAGANAAIVQIRAAGADQMILVPGSHWTGAHSWLGTDNAGTMGGVVDPGENFAYEVHQYLDSDGSGTSPEVVKGAGFSRLSAFTEWARSKGSRAFLGEFGWADNPSAHIEGEALLAFMSANRDVWLGWAYWAGGPWWGEYMFTLEPKNGEDRPQMAVIKNFLEQPHGAKAPP